MNQLEMDTKIKKDFTTNEDLVELIWDCQEYPQFAFNSLTERKLGKKIFSSISKQITRKLELFDKIELQGFTLSPRESKEFTICKQIQKAILVIK